MKGGDKLKTFNWHLGRALFVAVLLCMFIFVSGQMTVAGADGGACPQKENEKLFWCTKCEEIFTWNECGNLKYIWEFKGEQHSEEKAKHVMVPAWACLRTEYYCIRDGKKWSSNPTGMFCEGSKICLPFNQGFCDICQDDLASKKSRAKLDFKCEKCNKLFDEPGVGHEIDHKKEYAEHLVTFGKCEDCGEQLKAVCRQSGTCPHVPDF